MVPERNGMLTEHDPPGAGVQECKIRVSYGLKNFESSREKLVVEWHSQPGS